MMTDPSCLTCARIQRGLTAPLESCPKHPFAFGTFVNPEHALPEITMADIRRTMIRINNTKGLKSDG